MADLPSQARVVVIGGGVVGASCLYHLAKAGWTDCVLLEKNELTAGSTWHAAGNIPTFSSSWSIMNMQRYSAELYRGLAAEVDYPMNYHVTGSIRLGHTRDRLDEFRHVASMGRAQGMDLSIAGPDELKGRYPFLETHEITGALIDPSDGDIDPAQLTQALAKGARNSGAQVMRFCSVTGAQWTGSEWVLSTSLGEIRCEYVVNSAGYYARQVGKMFDRDVPMAVMSHQYMLFDEIPEIKSWSEGEGRKLPLLRDVDTSYYLRQEKYGMNLGPYERNCRAHWISTDDVMPDEFSFQLFPDDLERLESYIEDAVARVPVLGTAGLQKVINGPIPYTPDGNPLIGPMPGVPNAFEACVFTFGICQAGGAGKVLAEWVTEGGTEWDMWSCDPRRFTGYCDESYCIDTAMQVYGHEYAIHFPKYEWPAGRGKKMSPVHGRLVEQGAQFGAYNGWERANWFAKSGDVLSEEACRTWDREGPWHDRVREECHAVRDAVGILDLTGFSRYRLMGKGCGNWLSALITGGLPKPGRIGLGYFADARGRIVTEMSITTIEEDHFVLTTAAAAQWHDLGWLEKHLPEASEIAVEDMTDGSACFLVTGPASRSLFADVCDADLSLPWLSHQKSRIGGAACDLARVSFAGELGWEVHCNRADAEKIHAAITDAGQSHGLKPFGMYALDSLRIEKGYRTWKGDLSAEYSLIEAGLDRFIHWSKPDFIGRAVLEAERRSGPEKRFAAVQIHGAARDPLPMSVIRKNGDVVGEVTSSAWGHRVEGLIANTMLRTSIIEPGSEVDVEIFGETRSATILPDEPVWDPKNERLRA